MKKKVYAAYFLFLFALFMQAYQFFRYEFLGVEELQLENAVLEKNLDQQKLETGLANYQRIEMEQTVAANLKKPSRKAPKAEQYQYRNIASLVGEPKIPNLNLSETLFEKARQAFSRKEYERSNQLFEVLISKFPHSPKAIESHFLLCEGYYQTRDFEGSVETIQRMISLYPESDLTGYSMLRLAKIFRFQDRIEDSIEVYKTILSTYKDDKLRRQAKISLKETAL